MDYLKQQANCVIDTARPVEDLKPGADIAVHERQVTSARLAAAGVVAGEPQFVDRPQVELAMAVREGKDQVLISVLSGVVVPVWHPITAWLLVLIFVHSAADLSKRLDVTKAVEEW